MGKSKGGDKNLEEAEGDRPVLVTRDELDQLSMDMQRKLDDFAHGQIELSRQQAEATKEFNKCFDQLTALLTFQNAPPRVQRYAAGTSSHQSSVHGMGEQQHNDTPQSFVRPPGQTQQL
jgi:hypothetical protein